MKKLSFLALILFMINSFGQDKTNKDVLSKINKLEKRVDSVKLNIDSIKQDESSFYLLKSMIINDKLDYQQIKEDVRNAHINFFTKYFNVGILLGGVLSLLGFSIFGIKEIKRRIAEQIAEMTKRNIALIRKNIDEIMKHEDLKGNSKILILNEKKTELPDGFKKVMNLFEINLEKDKIDIEGLNKKTIKTVIDKIKKEKIDLLIIENQVSDNKWYIQTQKIDDELTDEQKTKVEEGNKLIENNKKMFIELANGICDKTAILYYGLGGDGFFPATLVDESKQHMVTFANAPSQLYGNMLNMLKFQNELKNAK